VQFIVLITSYWASGEYGESRGFTGSVRALVIFSKVYFRDIPALH
jgi:hypothetical protein